MIQDTNREWQCNDGKSFSFLTFRLFDEKSMTGKVETVSLPLRWSHEASNAHGNLPQSIFLVVVEPTPINFLRNVSEYESIQSNLLSSNPQKNTIHFLKHSAKCVNELLWPYSIYTRKLFLRFSSSLR